MTEILNGTVLAKAIREKAKQRLENVEHPPGLAVLLAGDNSASHLYVRLKEEAAREVGIYVEKHVFGEDAKTRTLQEKIRVLNKRPDINGILVQLPLPVGIDTDKVINTIDPKKDIDGFHPENRKALLANTPLLVPPVSLAIMRLIQATRQPLKNKTAVILGNSEIFAEPLMELLRDAGVSNASFITRDTPGYNDICRVADIVIVAVGQAGFLTRSMIKDSAIVIDVGTNKTTEGKVIGDASPDLEGHAGFLSKVPGGVGPLTVAYLLMNAIKAKEVQGRE